jgi:hypothetical protein
VSDKLITVHSLHAEATLPDTTPVNPSMTYDGATVAQISIPSGKFVITDCYFGFGFVYWTIEVDYGLGGGFVVLANFGFTLLAPATTEELKFKAPIVIQGGAGVAVRLRAMLAEDPINPVDVSASIRCYTETVVAGPTPMPFTTRQNTVITLTDLATTGTTQEILNMSENGGTPGLSIPVPAGSFLQIDDFHCAGGPFEGIFRLQQTNDGVTWFTLAALEVSGTGSGMHMLASPNTSWKINGNDGPAVAARIAITTPTNPIPVTSFLSGYRVS